MGYAQVVSIKRGSIMINIINNFIVRGLSSFTYSIPQFYMFFSERESQQNHLFSLA